MDIILSIVGKVTEYAVEPAIRQVGYVINCKSKLQDLQTSVDKLNAASEGVHRRITRELIKGDQQTETVVTKWLEQVAKKIGEANELGRDDIQAKMSCLYGFCPNVKLCHKLGRNSTKLKLVVDQLYGEKEFPRVARYVRPQEPCLISPSNYRPFVSRASIVKDIMDELRVPSTNFIMVYGVGGVGKTTLVEEVHRKAHEEKIFADVIMVQAAEKLDLKEIQKKFAKKLGVEVRQDMDMEDIRTLICNSIYKRIPDERILVILDNILEKFTLESLGIPCLPACRIVLTSRNRNVLSSYMWSPKYFQLEVLDANDSWSLFEMTCGHILKDLAIESIARKVVKECGGLPVLIVAVAGALRNRTTPHAWNDILRSLQQFINQDSIEEEEYSKAYSGLEWSYNQLNDGKNLKPLLLICGILQYTEGEIVLSHLLKYAMGMSLLKNVSTVEEATDALYTRIEELQDACLLLVTEDTSSVKMHDLICNVAIRIASRNERALLRARGGELKKWPSNTEFFENCTMISLSCSNVPSLPEVLECQELQLFQYVGSGDKEILKIPDSFCKELRKLMVLDLTDLLLFSLPESLVSLTNLQTLCLHDCALEDIALVGQLTTLEFLSFVGSAFGELPKEIGNLTRLRLLDLTGCYFLRVIAPGVISGLKSLEDLRMNDCAYKWELEGFLELKELSHVAALEIYIEDLRMIPTGLFSDKLKRYRILIGPSCQYSDLYNVDQTVNALVIDLTDSRGFETGIQETGIQTLLERSEVLYLRGDEHKIDDANIGQLLITSAITRKVVLPNLTRLCVDKCDRLKALFTYPMARSLVELKYLRVKDCGMMEEIVSAKEHGDENTDGMLPKLQCLELGCLWQLSRFSSRSNISIEFPSLESLQLNECPILETFILDPKSERTYSLFDDMVAFPRLQKLNVSYCHSLRHIFPCSDATTCLQWLNVSFCQSLRYIFPCSVATTSLQWLEYLKVEHCHEMKEIIATQEGLETTPPTFVFPRLLILDFGNLPRLESFYPGIHASKWPLLKTFSCKALGEVAMGVSEFQKQDELGGPSTPITQSLVSVDKSDGDGGAFFPQLSDLSLKNMPKLIYVCKDEFSSARLFFPNLEVLLVEGCVRLKDLGSSTILFQNLKSLEVNCCHSLTHLMTYTIAKSSMRLRKMTVASCIRMTEIVATSDRDDGQIAFSQLEELTLYNLPSLQNFCSGNCTVKFPSLKSLFIENYSKLKINCLEWKASPELQGVGMMQKPRSWNHLAFLMSIDELGEDNGPYMM